MTVETAIQWLGGLLAFSVLGILRHGVWLGTRREVGRTVGLKGTWLRSSVLYFACMSPLILMRARREDEALAAEFGDQWEKYRQRVPALFPRLRQQQPGKEQFFARDKS